MPAPRARIPSPRRSAGFTLLELIVVITIIGLLSTIVVVSTRNLPAKGRHTKVVGDLQSYLTVANAIYTETGRWPESLEEMANAKSADGKPLSVSLEKIEKDPWGNEYRYEVIDGAPRVTCLGSDNAEGGDGEAEDVIRPEPPNS
jgi:general secretion pathway protein G